MGGRREWHSALSHGGSPGGRTVRNVLVGGGRSLATRLTVVATAVTAIALLGLLAALYVVLSGRLSAAVDEGLAARYNDVRADLDRGNPVTLVSEQYVELYTGAETQRSAALQGAAPLVLDPVAVHRQLQNRSIRLATGAEVQLRVLADVGPNGRVLAVAASRRTQQQAARQLFEALVVAGPLLLLLVALVVHRTAGAALRPVDALTQMADRVSGGRDMVRRPPPVAGTDELARLSRTLDAMLGRLEVAFQRERAFVDDASHELRTPITVLRGELELALSDLDDHEGVEQSLRAALAEAERLSQLAEDLLVLARERAGALTLLREPLDVGVLLRRTAARLGPATGLTVRVESIELVALGDAARLELVLANLITNAAQAGASTALLRAEVSPSQLLLSVEDDGPGFPAGFADSAFERFTRADEARTRTTGAGLGLALVAAIAAAAGGGVRAAGSARLGGASVQVWLPLMPG
jgi:signal transduction histidine kinase